MIRTIREKVGQFGVLSVLFLAGLSNFVGQSVHADEIHFESGDSVAPAIPVEIVEGERAFRPVPGEDACAVHSDPVLIESAERKLMFAMRAIRCGDLIRARVALKQVELEIADQLPGSSKTERGYCYEEKDCAGDLVVKKLVTLGECKAASGSSWKRVTPREGRCVNR